MKIPAWLRAKSGFTLTTWVLGIALLIFVLSTIGNWPGATAEAIAAGKKPKPDAYAKTYIWWAAVADLGLLILLGLTARWWKKPLHPNDLPQTSSQSVPPPPLNWRYWLMVAFILVLALWLRVPRMNLSFYNDEAYSFVRMVSGDWKERDGDMIGPFRAAKWSDTLWLNSSGNNSQPHSILSRLSYDFWRKSTKAAQGEVNEAAVRVPALIAGIAGILLFGLGIRAIAGHGASIWAMLVLALHGWHVRYSTEARGYSLMLLGICAGWWFLHRAVHSGRWRDWTGYGASMLLTIWSFPGSVYFLAAQNGLLMLWLGWRWWRKQSQLPYLLRPIITGMVAVMIALPLLLPLLPQLVIAINSVSGIRGKMDMTWQMDIAGYLLAGCRAINWHPENPENASLSRWLVEWRWPVGILITLMAALIVFGSIRLLRKGGVAALLVLSGPLAMELAWFLMRSKEQVLHHWYALYTLPGVMAGLVAGIVGLRKLQIPVGTLALVLPLLGTWHWRSHTKQHEREPVIAARGAIHPHYTSHDALLAGFWCNSVIYDPYMVVLKTDNDFEAIVKRARDEKRDLYITFSHAPLAKGSMPQAVQRLEKGDEFTLLETFWGQEESQFTEYLYKLNQPD